MAEQDWSYAHFFKKQWLPLFTPTGALLFLTLIASVLFSQYSLIWFGTSVIAAAMRIQYTNLMKTLMYGSIDLMKITPLSKEQFLKLAPVDSIERDTTCKMTK